MRAILATLSILALGATSGSARAPAATIDAAAKDLAQTLADILVDAGIERVAVMSFEDPSGRPTPLGERLALEVQRELSSSKAPIEVLERKRVDRLFEEQQRSALAIYDPETVAQIGKMLGAEALIYGAIDPETDTVVINARAIAVETAKVLGAAKASIDRSTVADRQLETRPNHRSRFAPPHADVDAEVVDVAVHAFVFGLEQRTATVILRLENRLEEDLLLAFAKGDFGICDVALKGGRSRRYRLVDGRCKGKRVESEIGAGGLACVATAAPRSDYTRIGAGDTVLLPLTFRANHGESMVAEPLTLEARFGRYTPEGRVPIEKALSGIVAEVP